MLISNFNKNANKGKLSGQLALEHIFGFCRTFSKIEKKDLDFIKQSQIADLQDNLSTTLAKINAVKIDNKTFFVPTVLPSAETQRMFNGSTKRVLFYPWMNGLLIE